MSTAEIERYQEGCKHYRRPGPVGDKQRVVAHVMKLSIRAQVGGRAVNQERGHRWTNGPGQTSSRLQYAKNGALFCRTYTLRSQAGQGWRRERIAQGEDSATKQQRQYSSRGWRDERHRKKTGSEKQS